MLKTVTASLPKRLLLLLALCACSMAQAQATYPGARIGWVSTERLYTESKLARTADARIEAEFSKRQKALQDKIAHIKSMSDKFDADAPALGEAERTKRTRELMDIEKDMQRMDREFREDLMQRKNEERSTIAQKAYKAIQQIAEQDHLDAVLDEAAWYNPRIDITEKILKQLDQ